MKKFLVFIPAVFVGVSFWSSTVFAQNTLDSLFFRDGRVEGVTVSRSTSDMIQFSYPNETLQNEIRKSELIRIKYGSGRIEQLSVIEDALPVPEPEFIGETYLIKEDNGYALLDKEVPQYKHGTYSSNKIKLKGPNAKLQTANNGIMSFIVKASDNQSDPMSIITIYRFKSSSVNRKVKISTHNNPYRSKTLTKSEMPFTAEKYGNTSYFLTATDYKDGEYGITVNNPNNVDEKKTIFNCIGVSSHQLKQLKQPKQPKQPKQHGFVWYQGEMNIGGTGGEKPNYGIDELGATHKAKNNRAGLALSTIHGIRISKYGFVGVGAEFIGYIGDRGHRVWYEDYYDLSVFPNLKGYLPINDRLEAYASVSVGGQILNKGLYAETGVGLNYGHLNVMVGYQRWNINDCDGRYHTEGYNNPYSYPCKVDSKYDAFVLKVGVRF